MKKNKCILALAAAVLLAGTWGCSMGNLGESSDKDGIVKTLVHMVLDRSGEEEDSLADEESNGENRENENSDREDGNREKENEVLTENGEEESSILNNGHSIVCFQGNAYYWKYTADSVEDDGLFAYFYLKPDITNEMICRYTDGTEEVLFTMVGNGNIYLAGDRMYLEANRKIYSVKMDGSDRIDYGIGRWEGADKNGEKVIGYSDKKLFSIDSRTGERKELADSSASIYNYEFVGTIDGYLYYSLCDTNSRELIVYQYNLDSSGEIEEVDRFLLPEDLLNIAGGVFVTQLNRLENTLYYSYGCYAGTGGFFQTGGINYILQDENRNTVESGVLVNKITAEEFLVEDNQDAVNVYFIDGENGSYIGFWPDTPYTGCMVMDTGTGTVQPSDFRLSRPGAVVYLDGAVCMADEHQASYTILIPQASASAYGCSDENPETAQSTTIIRDVEIIGSDVYYTVEKSSRDPQQDMGWRPGFIRISSERYKMPVGGSEAELLFSY